MTRKRILKGQKGSPKHTECIFRGLEKKIGQAARGLLEKLNFLKEALDNLHLIPTERFNSKHAPGGEAFIRERWSDTSWKNAKMTAKPRLRNM